MSDALSILLIDDNDSDRALARSVIHQRFPSATITEVTNALTFAEHFASGDFDVAISEMSLRWADGQHVLGSIQREYVGCVTIGMADTTTLTGPLPHDQTGDLGDVLEKTSAGYMALPQAISRGLEGVSQERHSSVAGLAYKRYVEELPVGIFSLNLSGTLTDVNEEFSAALAYADASQIIGLPFYELLSDTEARALCRTLFSRGDTCTGLHVEMLGADQQTVSASLSFWPIPAPDWAPASFEGVMWPTDGPDRVAAPTYTSPEATSSPSQEVTPQDRPDVASANEIDPSTSATAPDDASDLAKRLHDSASRMQDMAHSIGAQSGPASSAPDTEAVDLETAIHSAVDSLEASTSEFAARIEWEQLPVILANGREMVELLYGLLAIAVRLPGSLPVHVDVDVEDQRDHWVIRVHRPRVENGDELDESLGSQLPPDLTELLGANSGLALCKRIAENHEGAAWTRSTQSGITLFASISKRLPMHPTTLPGI
ncbi:MAG: hypothetical protein K0U93_12435 [Gammaproteobacteria bacterium]|nr:hypothetical protein [Gammaproteobacteria bacterium]